MGSSPADQMVPVAVGFGLEVVREWLLAAQLGLQVQLEP